MSCFCLFGKKKSSTDSIAQAPPVSAATNAPVAQNHGAVKELVEDSSAVRTETESSENVQLSPDMREYKDMALVGGESPPRTDNDNIGLSNVSAQIHEPVPDWVQRESKPAAFGAGRGAEDTGVVVGEIGSMNHGTGGFQTRATPRTVFRQAEPHSGRAARDAASIPVSKRPPRPPPTGGDGDITGENVCDWMQYEHGKTSYGAADRRGRGVGEEVMVRDSDTRCAPGADVLVSERWLHVPYFKPFTGVRGKLTRRGVNGATWYAAFPGCPEQAFSTGMYAQYILCYAPVHVLLLLVAAPHETLSLTFFRPCQAHCSCTMLPPPLRVPLARV